MDVYKNITPNLLYEDMLIGMCLMSDKPDDVIFIVLSKLKEAQPFYKQKNNEIWLAILNLAEANELIDLVTVTAKLESLKLKPDIDYMDSLMDRCPAVSSLLASYYCDIVQNEMRWVRAHRIQVEIQEKLFSYDKDIDGLKELYQRGINDLKNVNIDLHSAKIDMNKLIHSINVDKPVFYDTGFIDLDRIIDGLYGTEYVIIAGRPSIGKTSFALACAMNLSLHDKVMFISYEMSKEMLCNKILSSVSGIDCTSVKRKFVAEGSIPKIITGASSITENLDNLFILDNVSTNYNDLAEVIIRAVKVHNVKIFFIDYFGYLRDKRYGDNRQQELSFVSAKLKRIAMDNDIVVIVLSQMNRGNESRADKRPMLADLRDTGSLEQDADLVMMLYREDYQTEENISNTLEVIVRKNKNGYTGIAKLYWDRRTQKYGNLARGGFNG